MRSQTNHGFQLILLAAALTAPANLLLRNGVVRAAGSGEMSKGLVFS